MNKKNDLNKSKVHKNNSKKTPSKSKKELSNLSKSKNNEVSQKDLSLIEESFKIIKNLNTQVSKVEKGKNKLAQDMEKLHTKLENHEKSTKNNFENKFFLSLKEEIIKEFAPILEKLDLKSIKFDVFKEIGNIIEIEVMKLKNDISSKTNKLSNESKKKFENLEIRIIDSINFTDDLKKKLNTFESKDMSKVFIKLEEKVYSIIEKNQRKIQNLFKSNNQEFEMLKSTILEQKLYSEKLNKKLDIFKIDLKKIRSSEGIDLTSIISKIKKLDLDNSSMKSLIERYENDLYSNQKTISIEIEKRLKKQIDEINKNKVIFESDKDEIKTFVVEKTNSIIDNLNIFEKKITILEKNNISSSSNQLQKKFDLLNDETHEALKDTLKDLSININSKLDLSLKDFDTEKSNFKMDINTFKENLSNSIKTYNSKIDSELENIHKKSNSFSHKRLSFKEEFKKIQADSLTELKNSINNDKKQLKLAIDEVKLEKDAEKDFIVNKYNSILDILKTSEESNTKKFSQEFLNLNKKYATTQENLETSKKSFISKLNLQFNENINKSEIKLNSILKGFINEKESIKNYIHNLETQISQTATEFLTKIEINSKNLNIEKFNFEKEKTSFLDSLNNRINIEVAILDKKLISFTDNVSISLVNLEKEKQVERDYISKKTNEIIDSFQNLSLENKTNLIKLKNDSQKIIENMLEKSSKKSREDVSSEILKMSEFLTRITIENKEDKRDLKEEIENKFIISKEQFESEFNSNLLNFDTELKKKEEGFLYKLDIFEKEKTQKLEELNIFKTEISNSSKNYFAKLDFKINEINVEKLNFPILKKNFQAELENLTHIRKIEIEDFSKQIENKLIDILSNEKNTFLENENTFRDLFNEKISNLHHIQKTRLDSVEKKFIEKNLRYVKEVINDEKKAIAIINEEVKSKFAELNKKLESMDSKENDFYEQIKSEEVKLNTNLELKVKEINSKFESRISEIDAKEINFNEKLNLKFTDLKNREDLLGEKIELRMVGLEKQFNKRFLDYDSDFSRFKNSVVDEVEGLMSDVTTLVEKKTENFDKNLTKLNFVNNEATNRLNDLNKLSKVFESQILGIRNEVHDMKIKQEIMEPIPHSLNDHVLYMSEYENQLIALIKNLKNRDIPENSIREALVNKGHPRFYVSMILQNYDHIIN